MDENSASFLLKLETHGAVSSFSYVFMSSFKFSIRFRFIFIYTYSMYFRWNSFIRGMRSQSGPDPLSFEAQWLARANLRISRDCDYPPRRQALCLDLKTEKTSAISHRVFETDSFLTRISTMRFRETIQVNPYGLCSIFLSRNFTFQCLRVFCRKIACKTHPIVRHKLSCRAEVECKFQIMLMNTSGTDATCHHHKLWNRSSSESQVLVMPYPNLASWNVGPGTNHGSFHFC